MRMLLPRRGVLTAGAGLLVGCGADLKLSAGASYDDVLAAIDRTEFEIPQGSNHAPMTADALVASGQADRVASWVESYGRQLSFAASSGTVLSERSSALGVYARRFDWVSTFASELEQSSPRVVVSKAFSLLGPGLFAAGWHGLLRAAHAYRAVEREPTPATRRELANGLAFWAARFQELPGTPGASARSGLSITQALLEVPLVPSASRVSSGLISDQVGAVKSLTAFVTAVEAVDLRAQSSDDSLNALVKAAARLFVNVGGNDIVLLHAITGTSALRLLWPALDDDARRAAIGFAFRTVAAAYAVKAKGPQAFDPVASPTTSADALLEKGGARSDEHDIKLTEACVREFRAGGGEELLAAAEARLRP